MDRRRFSAVAHEGIALWNPLDEDAVFQVVDAIELGPEGRAIDIGCGRAGLLLRLLERTGATGVGVDPAPEAIARARADAEGRVDPARLDLRAEPFDPSAFEAGLFDVAACIGATHAFGGTAATLAGLRRLVRPGGTALLGDGWWRREPDPEYLAFLGATRDEMTDAATARLACESAGFRVVDVVVSTPEDFDRYEDRYAANVERFVAAHPDDPDGPEMLARIRAWRAAYLRWGRETMGFALYVLGDPGYSSRRHAAEMWSMKRRRTPPCNCDGLEGHSKEPDHPIRWDSELNEYYIASGTHNRTMIYYCPFCGGSAPESRRQSLFAHVTQAEEMRIAGLFTGVHTVADAIARFGEPDERRDVAVLYGGGGGGSGAPQRGEAFGGLVYRSLSPVADIVFEVGSSGTVRGTWSAKGVERG